MNEVENVVSKHYVWYTGVDCQKGIFSKTRRISFELSNRCNYAPCHKNCPLSLKPAPHHLPAHIVYKVLNTLKKHEFEGMLSWHNYSEPLIDPRLFMFLKHAHSLLPKCRMLVMTNGFNLDQVIYDELSELGITSLIVTAYSDEERERIKKINTSKHPIPYAVVRKGELDERLSMYDSEPIDSKQPCLAPLNDILIINDGRVCLCCMEWQRRHIFGDLNTQSLEEIINSEKAQSVYNDLSHGNRKLDICRRCVKTR